MKQFTVKQIGTIRSAGEKQQIILNPRYVPALSGLDGFTHLQVLWWFSGSDNQKGRGSLKEASPYRHSPAMLGTFATRSPLRANPIALSAAQVIHIDYENALIDIAYIDAYDDSPVLDLKPYTPSLDRVETARGPGWCAHWPQSYEQSGDFDWESEFRF